MYVTQYSMVPPRFKDHRDDVQCFQAYIVHTYQAKKAKKAIYITHY